MVKFTIEELKKIMSKVDNIRNMSVIAHVDHGKSTLTDSLLARSGIISQKQAGTARATDSMKEEQDRGITIKSTGVSMFYERQIEEENLTQETYNKYLFNLIDSPGHVDFSSEVTAALRVTDGALVIVDCIEGVCVQTETVLRQACAERIKSALVINKLDRVILEKQLDGEEIYQQALVTIDNVNVILSTYLPEQLQNNLVDPVEGNVAFAAGKQCWGFTIPQMATRLSKQLKVDKAVLQKRLWGDNFYDPISKKWKKEPYNDQGDKLKRGFVQFIMEPIIDMHRKIMVQENLENVFKKLENFSLQLTNEESKLRNKDLLKTIMSRWLNAGDALFDMMIDHLPSPREAMKYRTELLYQGPIDDDIANSMKESNSEGPLLMYVSKMVPNADFSKFYAFGRVFSGTLHEGQKVQIMGPSYSPGSKDDLYFKTMSMPVLMMGKNVESVSEIPAGNTCAIIGIDNYLVKTGTIATHPDSYPIKSMSYSVSPVVRVAVSAKNPSDIMKLINGLQKLQKYDNLVQCIIDQNTGQNIVAGSGELHIEVCLKLLSTEFAKCEIVVSDPIVSYKETILKKSEQGLAKSANGHNRIWSTVEPIGEELCKEIEAEKISLEKATKEEVLSQTDRLVDTFQWDRDECKKMWTFGPEPNDPNILVDSCSQVAGLNFIKDSIISAFKGATREGVLTQEQTRGIKMNLHDAKVHSDPMHRGGNQIIPMTRNVIYGTCLNAQPTLQEPIFSCDISVPSEVKNSVYNLLNKRKGHVYDEELVQNTPLCNLKAYLPVEQSFGFTEALRQATQGQAFPQCMFDHWKVVQGDIQDQESRLYKLVLQIRKRKGLSESIPDSSKYLNKL